MEFLYVTDLHGDKDKYEKIFEIALADKIKVIVNGGDMLPKRGHRHLEQPIFIDEYLKDYFGRLQKSGIIYLAMLGNDDLLAVDQLFGAVCNEFDNVYNLDNRIVRIDGYEFIGMNAILDHPFGCKDRVVNESEYVYQVQLGPVAGISHATGYRNIYNWSEYLQTNLLDMRDILNKLPEPKNLDKTVYVMHMPPVGLCLGQLYRQDLDIGSVAIYEFLKHQQPKLSLHGHIHEAPDMPKGKWLNHILKTTCIQTGQSELGDEELIYAKIDLDNQNYQRKKCIVK